VIYNGDTTNELGVLTCSGVLIMSDLVLCDSLVCLVSVTGCVTSLLLDGCLLPLLFFKEFHTYSKVICVQQQLISFCSNSNWLAI